MEDSSLIDEALDRYRQPLGSHYPRYRGHVYRVYHYTRHLIAKGGGDSDADDSAIALAAAFHDLSFATDQTLDYLSPSIVSATEHLEALGLADLAPAVGRMIRFHHKLTPSGAPTWSISLPCPGSGCPLRFVGRPSPRIRSAGFAVSCAGPCFSVH
jgi:predicted metal-dependent HD superfamily phosphohydrolase